MKLERNPSFHYGARFFRDGDRDMFEHRIDSRSCIGPRIATKVDKQNHPELWSKHLASITEEADRKLKRKAK
jgi:hypothetical protein